MQNGTYCSLLRYIRNYFEENVGREENLSCLKEPVINNCVSREVYGRQNINVHVKTERGLGYMIYIHVKEQK